MVKEQNKNIPKTYENQGKAGAPPEDSKIGLPQSLSISVST